jgi:hypothetical protein
LLAISLRDNQRARILSSDGMYRLKQPVSGKRHRSQFEFIALAATNKRRGMSEKNHSKYPRVEVKPSPFAARGK